MGKQKNKGAALGRSIMRDRFKKGGVADAEGWIHTTELNDGYDWGRLQSVTEQGDLDEFLATAKLAGTEFTAEKLNVTVVSGGEHNSAHMSVEKAKAVKEAQEANMDMLRVPRRPKWDENTSGEELQLAERETFLEWRRQLAVLQEKDHITLSPFERNIEVWRQLWRVIERSHVIVQIVDARNPLLRSDDLDKYVAEVDPSKRTLLLINKADMLSQEQRNIWKDYLNSAGIPFAFWSANLEKKRQERLEAELALLAEQQGEDEEDGDAEEGSAESAESGESVDGGDDSVDDVESTGTGGGVEVKKSGGPKDATATNKQADKLTDALGERLSGMTVDADADAELGSGDDYADVLTREALLDLLRAQCPPNESLGEGRRKTIGLVGYPNVGKSSTINALCQDKKVAVSATPGKTKHFQTILLDEETLLCDCPGLVFPSFASTKAELVVSGMLPIDQMRDFLGPASLVAERIPRKLFETTYGIQIVRPGEDEDPNRKPTGHELLCAYGFARGFMTAHGSPDEPRSARYILKDYCKGKFVYCHPPPTMSADDFNATTIAWPADVDIGAESELDAKSLVVAGKQKTPRYDNRVDRDFFRQSDVGVVVRGVQHGAKGDHVKIVHPHKRNDQGADGQGKKHNNKHKREKVRRVMNEA
eukprot:Opistho-2@54093